MQGTFADGLLANAAELHLVQKLDDTEVLPLEPFTAFLESKKLYIVRASVWNFTLDRMTREVSVAQCFEGQVQSKKRL